MSECPSFVWTLLAFLGFFLVISLVFNIASCVEKQRQNKNYYYADDCLPRDDEYYPEDAPIYGNLENVPSGPTDESCYEQMKSRPERAVNEKQERSTVQEEDDAQMCYASLDHSFKGKRRKPKVHFSQDDNKKLNAVKTRLPKTDSVSSFREEREESEENIHDDPIRLFGLIHAKKEQICVQEYDPA